MHSSSSRQLNSYYHQEDSIDCYLTKLKIFFLSLINFSYGFLKFVLFVFRNLFVFTYVRGDCKLLRIVSLIVNFAAIDFYFLAFS